ncbi:MAG TPA: hypothetical protein VG406_03540 [Isosphaeraceae bacterium]|jgi:hypothetical protein|nr:hypothetical protein [Isosphaeraceae bacterium]
MPADADEPLALVHRGWEHLRLQRPLAAWACWQQALRLDPGREAARQALDVLAHAVELPAAARASYRFRGPTGEGRRARWDAVLRDRDLSVLVEAAAAFEGLADADADDDAARFNLALCRAWLGQNMEAIATLDEFVNLSAGTDAESAVSAWMLAEVLRHGAGAEAWADDFDYRLSTPWRAEDGDPTALTTPPALIRPLANPLDPALAGQAGAGVFEWIEPPRAEGPLPRVLATLVLGPGTLRLSTPDPDHLPTLRAALEALGRPVEPTRAPLPLRLLDAAAWTFRFPTGLDDADRPRLAMEAIASYYEERWIQHPRTGLGGRPFDAAVGDAADRARLEAVIRVREQLASRPRFAPLAGGYDFDRLRRRLGLIAEDPQTDPEDRP